MTVIDYGMGNVGSIVNMLKKIGVEPRVAESVNDIRQATRLVLPGVGAFDNAIIKLREKGYAEVLRKRVCGEHVPILGICLGMQLFAKRSEEGSEDGLGWLDAEVVRFRSGAKEAPLRIPHMGWNTIDYRCNITDLKGSEVERYYFVHSYYLKCANKDDILATANYGSEFVAAVCRGNILGTQYHPEKSHRFGMQFLQRFARWEPLRNGATA